MNKIPIFLYHGVRGCDGDAIGDPYYSLPLSSIQAQLAWFKRNNFKSCSLSDALSAGGDFRNRFVVTIDDCLKSTHDSLMPIITRSGFKATLFPIVGRIGHAGWMGWPELAYALKTGWEIGSHTITHANFAELPDSEVIQELSASKKILEDKLGAPVRYLSLPGGYYRSSIMRLAAETGYEAICGSRFGYNRLPLSPAGILNRFNLKGSDNERTVAHIMRGETLSLLPGLLRERGARWGRAVMGRHLYSAVRGIFLPAGAYRELPRFPLQKIYHGGTEGTEKT